MLEIVKRTIARVGLLCREWVRHEGPYRLTALSRSGGMESMVRVVEECEGELAVDALRRMGAIVGHKVRIGRGLTLHNAELPLVNLVIGDDCHIGRQVFLDLTAPVELGNHVTLTMRCMVLTHADAGGAVPQYAERVKTRAGVHISDEVYVGAGTTVMPGVTLGEGALVGACCLVTKDVAAGDVVAGVPAKSIVK